MTKIAYFDCFSGCSGDMVIGSLLDAGLSPELLKQELKKIPLSGYGLIVEKVLRSAIMATRVTVTVLEAGDHPERHLSDILSIIENSTLAFDLKEQGTTLFRRIAEVEAEIHGEPLESVHFHELGGVDSIIDIMGALIGLKLLGIERCYSSPLVTGSGTVFTLHGHLGVPAPATLKLLEMAHAPIAQSPHAPQTELLTPTGALLLTSLAEFGRPEMVVHRTGYGAGHKDFERWPNVLCVWLGETNTPAKDSDLVLLETNIDDMNPEIYGYLMDRLFERGALDVWFTPIYMKKNRPATMVSVIIARILEPEAVSILMKETSTLGVRTRSLSRHSAERTSFGFKSSFGDVQVKIKRFEGKITSISPEYEYCSRIAIEKSIPLHEIYRILEHEAREQLCHEETLDVS